VAEIGSRWPAVLMTAAVVAIVVGSMAVGCGSSSGTRAAATTGAPTVASTSSAPWNRARAEAEVRAAYQNFRVKLRELERHPSPTNPIIDQLYVPAKQADVVRWGLHSVPSRGTRWRVLSVRVVDHTSAVVHDCLVDAEVAMKGSKVVNRAVGTYEGDVTFLRRGQRWLIRSARQLRALKGVTGCASTD